MGTGRPFRELAAPEVVLLLEPLLDFVRELGDLYAGTDPREVGVDLNVVLRVEVEDFLAAQPPNSPVQGLGVIAVYDEKSGYTCRLQVTTAFRADSGLPAGFTLERFMAGEYSPPPDPDDDGWNDDPLED